MREIILDTETTGLSPEQGHKVIEIGCVELFNRKRTGSTFQVYINPERDVPEEAFKIHGISTESLRDKPKFLECSDLFLEFIADSVLIAHNAEFDVKFLNYELNLLNLPTIDKLRVLDTLKIARKKFPGSPNNLNALCKRFNIDLSSRNYHGALLDAELLADVYLELTGGSQASMEFVEKKTTKVDGFYNKNYKDPRSFSIIETETLAHNELLAKIKKPIWVS